MKDGRRAFTLVEVLVALGLSAIVAGVLYGAFGFLFGSRSPSSIGNLTDRSFVQKDIRMAMRKLFLRLREGTQILDPAPGATTGILVVRDILNDRIRMRLVSEESCIVSERFVDGSWQRETTPRELALPGGDTVRPAFPIRIPNCSNVSFTAVSPTCVVVHLTLSWRGDHDTLLTAITLRNAKLAN